MKILHGMERDQSIAVVAYMFSHAFCFEEVNQVILTTLDQHSDTDSLSSQIGEFDNETFATSTTDFLCVSVLSKKYNRNIVLIMLAILLGPQYINPTDDEYSSREQGQYIVYLFILLKLEYLFDK